MSLRTRETKSINLSCFEEIYEKYVFDVYRFVYRISLGIFHQNLSKDTIADIIQDIFIAIWKSLHRFKHKSQLKTWIYAIAYKSVQKKFRDCHELLHPPLSFDKPVHNFGNENNFTLEESLPAPGPSAEESLHTKLLIQTVLSRLSKEQRAILIWEYLGELNPEDTAKLLNRSRCALRSLRYRALKQARRILSELKCYQNKKPKISKGHLNNLQKNLIITHTPT